MRSPFVHPNLAKAIVQLTVHNIRTQVHNPSGRESRFLREYLSIPDERAKFATGNFGTKQRIHLYDSLNDLFPAGFTRRVMKAAKAEGISVQISDARTPPCSPDPDIALDWLRDYQLEAIDAVVKRTRGLLKLPTGAGKTEIAIGLALKIPTKWLFLVHKKDLLHQTVERYVKRVSGMTDLDPEELDSARRLTKHGDAEMLGVGRIGDGEWFEGERFTVATFQTLARALKNKQSRNHQAALNLLASVGGVMVDEAHTLPADSFMSVAMATRNAYYRVGLSGTPLARTDKRSFVTVGVLGDIIYELKAVDLIERGLLAKPIIRMEPVHHIGLNNIGQIPATFQGVYGKFIVRSATRNRAVVEACKLAKKPALVFVKEIKHGKILEERMRKAGIPVEFVFGNTDTPRRKSAIERLVRGEIEVLICSVIFQEGTDIPELESVVIASGGKSVIATLQRIGRGMRKAEGKGDTFEVWDFEDIGVRMLENHSKQRRRAYEKEGYRIGAPDVDLLSTLQKAAPAVGIALLIGSFLAQWLGG